MSQGESSTALVLTENAPAPLTHFLVPLVQGQTVHIGVPLTARHLNEAEAAVMTGNRSIQHLQLLLQDMATRLVPHAVHIELTVEDIRMAAAAYQICWFFHWSVEEGRIWKRRLDNVVKELGELLARVGLPRTEAQLLGRHLLFRHLPALFRVDTRVEFGFFWGTLDFIGTEPDWVKLPGRSKGVMERSAVWVGQRVFEKPVGQAFWRLMGLTPLTALLHCDRLFPYFSFWGAASALSLPSVCRLVTSAYVDGGLWRRMPALEKAFRQMLGDPQESVAHRRYMARFLYNLVLTHVSFCDEDDIYRYPDISAFEPPDVQGVARTSRDLQTLDLSGFYAVIDALHALRGPLGAAHLMSDPELLASVERFVATASLNITLRQSMRAEVASGLQFEKP